MSTKKKMKFDPDQYKIHDGPRSWMPGKGDEHKVYQFPNQYGASVIRGVGTYGYEEGLWELGVLQFNSGLYNLTYDTPITDDVLGHLTWDEVEETLEKIYKLPEDLSSLDKILGIKED